MASTMSGASIGDAPWQTHTVFNQVPPLQDVNVVATGVDGKTTQFTTTCRIDTPIEIEYYRNGGILHTVLRRLLKK